MFDSHRIIARDQLADAHSMCGEIKSGVRSEYDRTTRAGSERECTAAERRWYIAPIYAAYGRLRATAGTKPGYEWLCARMELTRQAARQRRGQSRPPARAKPPLTPTQSTLAERRGVRICRGHHERGPASTM
jgi:hypothetical protein